MLLAIPIESGGASGRMTTTPLSPKPSLDVRRPGEERNGADGCRRTPETGVEWCGSCSHRVCTPGVPVTIYLEPEQLALFEELLEAWRGVPRDQRQPFLYIQLMAQNVIQGNGINKGNVSDGDVEALTAEGLISFDGDSFTIPPRSIAMYREWKGSHVEPTADVEAQITRYLDSQRFLARYPEAYARWREAAVLLWGEDSEQELSTIGHKCREAMQEFATALLALHGVQDANPDKAKTRDRFSAVVNTRRDALGDAKSAVLDALFDYWRATDKYIQRQEHAGQREGESLTPEDGRRTVFQTAVLMFEVDRTL
jgi:hypothetical protein